MGYEAQDCGKTSRLELSLLADWAIRVVLGEKVAIKVATDDMAAFGEGLESCYNFEISHGDQTNEGP